MKHVIIGNGVAGTTAAWHIRKTDPSASISVITEEPYPFYSRIRLPQLLAEETDEHGLVIHKPGWYANNRIGLILSTKVSAVDTARKKVVELAASANTAGSISKRVPVESNASPRT